MPVPARAWFPELDDEQIAFARERYSPAAVSADGETWVYSMRNHVVELGGRTIVVDTCAGNHKRAPGLDELAGLETDYLTRFVAAGFDPGRVDTVLSTHLHMDHVGWNTTLEDGGWRPTFPNARYLFEERDLAFVRSRAQTDELCRLSYEESILPVLEHAEHAVLDLAGHELAAFEGTRVVARAAYGHTPGHSVVEISSGPECFLLSGDLLHHPIQAQYPELPFAADFDSAQSAKSKVELLSRCADEGIKLLSAHLVFDPGSPIQRPAGVRRNGAGGFDWAL